MIENKFRNSFEQLKNYCEKEEYKGWDPYDGLNSKLFRAFGLHNFKYPRLAWIQAFVRSPFNLRNILLVPKQYNPKGLGLFLIGYCNLYKINPSDEIINIIVFIADRLLELVSKGYSGDCWGYNFDWQSRAFFLKKYTPTVVATSFVSYAMLEAYEITKNEKYLNSGLSSANFVLKDLNRTQKENGFIFSYSPYDHTRVYNASLLGSRLLAKCYKYSNDQEQLDSAKAGVQACCDMQSEDGSWVYGELPFQDWIDTFHTGYNLESIYEYQKYSNDNSFDNNIKIGTEYYLNNFFLDDGTPKYYHNKVYPIDIHAPAEFITAMSKMNKFCEAKHIIDKTLNWTIENMQDKKGYFYFRLKPGFSSKMPYMRWAQAWMFYGFTYYLREKND